MDYLQKLNEEQLKPVLDTEGQVLVLAGAGSGKTRVLTTRIAHLIKSHAVSPYQILAITFTNKAAKEMQERISLICDCDGMWICTIHSMCARILRFDIDSLGYTKSFTIYTEEEKSRIIKKIIKEMELDEDKLVKTASYYISDAKNKNISSEQFKRRYIGLDNSDLYSRIYTKYADELRRLNSLDFDDLLTVAYKLLSTCPDILKKYQEKFEYVHVDEFQDTNEIQFNIVKLLSGGKKNLFAVGDDDQSIYGWRGAEVRNILDFNSTYPSAKVYKLQRNYRSTKEILSTANKIILHNSQRMGKELYTENEIGISPEYYSGLDEGAEAYYVAKQIRLLVNDGKYDYSDFGVLMRVNALTRNLEQEFLKYNIPYKIYGGFKFFERKEIKDVLAYLRILVNPYDEDAIVRVINVPKRGIGDVAISALRLHCQQSGDSMLSGIMSVEDSALSNPIKSKIKQFKDVLSNLNQNLESKTPSEFLRYVIMTSGIFSMYSDDSEENDTKKLNLEELVSACQEFEKNNQGATIIDYIQSVTLSSELDKGEEATSSATLSTIHAAKGLEFKVVFIIGLDDNIFPLSRAKATLSELEEERRLMYVAITRARERLFFTRCESRYIYGKREYTIRSQFLKELDIPKERQSEKIYVPIKPISVNSESSKDLSKCISGNKILHKVFGEGVIISANGSGTTTMIDVVFKGIGMKTLAASIAPIEFI